MLEKRKQTGTLAELAGPDGLVHCVFICCDLPYQYIGEYFSKLEAEKFHPIKNEVSLLYLLVNITELSVAESQWSRHLPLRRELGTKPHRPFHPFLRDSPLALG
jgi:hypothetical protein